MEPKEPRRANVLVFLSSMALMLQACSAVDELPLPKSCMHT